jgi:hypothetical protein
MMTMVHALTYETWNSVPNFSLTDDDSTSLSISSSSDEVSSLSGDEGDRRMVMDFGGEPGNDDSRSLSTIYRRDAFGIATNTVPDFVLPGISDGIVSRFSGGSSSSSSSSSSSDYSSESWPTTTDISPCSSQKMGIFAGAAGTGGRVLPPPPRLTGVTLTQRSSTCDSPVWCQQNATILTTAGSASDTASATQPVDSGWTNFFPTVRHSAACSPDHATAQQMSRIAQSKSPAHQSSDVTSSSPSFMHPDLADMRPAQGPFFEAADNYTMANASSTPIFYDDDGNNYSSISTPQPLSNAQLQFASPLYAFPGSSPLQQLSYETPASYQQPRATSVPDFSNAHPESTTVTVQRQQSTKRTRVSRTRNATPSGTAAEAFTGNEQVDFTSLQVADVETSFTTHLKRRATIPGCTTYYYNRKTKRTEFQQSRNYVCSFSGLFSIGFLFVL